MSSQAQINANRANAQHSTGPQSSTGKATSSLNAVKTGLTGVTVVLRTAEEAEAYRAHILSYEKQFNPVGPEEIALVQSISDIRWRLHRIPALEMALLTIGRQELGGSNEALDQPEFSAIVEMEIRRAYVKDFRNLHIQENRLVNRRQREMAELLRLQKERKAAEAEALEQAAQACLLARHCNQPFDLAAIGFEFSTQTLDAYLAKLTAARKQQLLQEALKGESQTAQAAA